MVVDLSFFGPCFIRKFFSLSRMSSIQFDMWVESVAYASFFWWSLRQIDCVSASDHHVYSICAIVII